MMDMMLRIPTSMRLDAMGENVLVGNDDIESNGRTFQETPPNIATTMRILIKAQEEQH